MQSFEEVLFFSATYNIKTEKKTQQQLIQLLLCQLEVGGLAEEKRHESDSLKAFTFMPSVLLLLLLLLFFVCFFFFSGGLTL